MSDKNDVLRSLPFAALAAALGIDFKKFTRRKSDWQGPCPIHGSKTNNNCFAYHDDGRYHCFSCNAKGRGAIDLTIAVRRSNFSSAVEFLGGVKPEPAKEKSPVVSDSVNAGDVELKPYTGSYEKFAVPCPWLKLRIPDESVTSRYGVFCYDNPKRKSAYSDRVMIPVKDIDGTLYGYLGRSYFPDSASDSIRQTASPKYLFPKNLPKSRFLFGAAEIAAGMFGPAPLRVVYLLESPFAVMKFASLGLPACSPFGWSVSPEQTQLLHQLAKGVVYLPDRNKAQECQNSVYTISCALWVRFPPLPAGIDDPEQLDRQTILAL